MQPAQLGRQVHDRHAALHADRQGLRNPGLRRRGCAGLATSTTRPMPRRARSARKPARSLSIPFDDEDVKAGQGTIALEILRDLPFVDMIFVPAGGGGLISGVAACAKQINPRIQIIGVQAEGAPAIANSFRAGKAPPRRIPCARSQTALRSKRRAKRTFGYIQ